MDEAQIESLLLEARAALAEGQFDAVLEAAGETIRLDRHRPEPFILLAHTHELRGDLVRAEESWERAVSKSRQAWERTGDEGTQGWWLESLDGLGHFQRERGSLEQAAGTYREQLRVDPNDPLGARAELAEISLLLGDSNGALAWAEGLDRANAIDQALRALAFLAAGNKRAAIKPARLALIENPLLVAAMMGEDLPDLGLDPELGLEVSEWAEGLRPWLEMRSEILDAFQVIATAPAVLFEVQSALDVALALAKDPTDDERKELDSRAAQIRNPERLEIEEEAILSELED